MAMMALVDSTHLHRSTAGLVILRVCLRRGCALLLHEGAESLVVVAGTVNILRKEEKDQFE